MESKKKKKERKKNGHEEPREKRNKDADLLDNGLEDMRSGNCNLRQSERVACTYIHYQM